jgi:hypothetical protein
LGKWFAGAVTPRYVIGALGDLDEHRIFGSIGHVIFGQFRAKASGVYAHGGIQSRVEPLRLPEYRYGKFIFLDGFARPVDGMLGQEGEEIAQDFGACELSAMQDSIHLLSDDRDGHGTVLHVAKHARYIMLNTVTYAR